MLQLTGKHRTRSGQSAEASHQLILRNSNLQDPTLIKVYTQLSNEEVEQHLKTTPAHEIVSGNDHETVWDYIHGQRGKSLAEAVQQVLAQQIEAVENVGYDAGVLMHYAHIHQVWNTHPDHKLRSRDAWLSALEMQRSLAAGVLAGALGENRKQKYQLAITQKWGDDWYENIDKSVRPLKTPDRLGQKELQCLAIIAESGISLTKASEKFKSTVATRLRKPRKLKDHRYYITRQDLELLVHWCRSLKRQRSAKQVQPTTHSCEHEGSQDVSEEDDLEDDLVEDHRERQSARRETSQSEVTDDDEVSVVSDLHESRGRMGHDDGTDGEQSTQANHSEGVERPHSSRPAKRARASSRSSPVSTRSQDIEACCQQIEEGMARLTSLLDADDLSESSEKISCIQALREKARTILRDLEGRPRTTAKDDDFRILHGTARAHFMDQRESPAGPSIDYLVTDNIEDEFADNDLFDDQ